MCVPFHPEKIGENFEKILTEKGMSIDDVAGKLGTTADDIRNWENEFPEMEVIARACGELGCSLEEIMAQ